ncbi:sugar ABC transporter substrate-binding protein [Arthrobacter sp. 35W]|uniref:sugar ABC transporter substrate-binding protein n=1 Tax=Arthrobacter sp. 35W TaxID=1132441 RepID=UPI001E610AE6|nr:sugar ABC transporter substrate-binding protein [Arthrobacter sp. 35W]
MAAVALTGTLAGCASSGGPGAATKNKSTLALPTYKPFTGVTPDFSGDGEALLDGFLNMPNPVASTTGKPLTGTVTSMAANFGSPAPPLGDNPYWQGILEAFGGNYEMQIVEEAGDGYDAKFATLLASNDLPQITCVGYRNIPNLSAMLEARFQDLTPYLSGDAVLEYPNLAALKTATWQTVVVNNKIWGVPTTSTPLGQVMVGNASVWEKVGGLNAKDADEFFEKAKEITNPKDKKYALEPTYINMLHMFTEWYGAPNNWAVNDDRTLTHVYETDAYVAGLEYAAKLFKAGVFYPDSSVPSFDSMVVNGSVGAQVVASPRELGTHHRIDPAVKMEILIPFGADGKTTPTYDLGNGVIGMAALQRNADEKAIKEQLSLLNWIAAPFGTKEYLAKNFGFEGRDFTFDANGNPILTKDGARNVPGVSTPLNSLTAAEPVNFIAGAPELTTYIQGQTAKLVENAWRNPTLGLYSDSEAKFGPKLKKLVRDKTVDIITGRASVSEHAEILKRWRAEGGDKMRAEYEVDLSPETPVFPLQPVK